MNGEDGEAGKNGENVSFCNECSITLMLKI